MNALEAILKAIGYGPEHVSATLLAYSVKHESKRTLEKGEKLAEAAISDPQTICEGLAPRLEDAGLMTREQVVKILGGEPS